MFLLFFLYTLTAYAVESFSWHPNFSPDKAKVVLGRDFENLSLEELKHPDTYCKALAKSRYKVQNADNIFDAEAKLRKLAVGIYHQCQDLLYEKWKYDFQSIIDWADNYVLGIGSAGKEFMRIVAYLILANLPSEGSCDFCFEHLWGMTGFHQWNKISLWEFLSFADRFVCLYDEDMASLEDGKILIMLPKEFTKDVGNLKVHGGCFRGAEGVFGHDVGHVCVNDMLALDVLQSDLHTRLLTNFLDSVAHYWCEDGPCRIALGFEYFHEKGSCFQDIGDFDGDLYKIISESIDSEMMLVDPGMQTIIKDIFGHNDVSILLVKMKEYIRESVEAIQGINMWEEQNKIIKKLKKSWGVLGYVRHDFYGYQKLLSKFIEHIEFLLKGNKELECIVDDVEAYLLDFYLIEVLCLVFIMICLQRYVVVD